MKDYLLELAALQEGYNNKLNIMREYLQVYILRIMHDKGIFRNTAFLGGTALRFLHGLPRFSEDLDFSLHGEKSYNFTELIKKIKEELGLAGYNVSVSYNNESIVWSAMVKFEKLMYEIGIAPFPQQKFSIKIEIDSRPPEGAILKTEIVNKYFLLTFLSYDLKSLFAGKIHALLSRKYYKGRDFFDLGWYLSKWKDLEPNFLLLKNALIQTGWKNTIPSNDDWREFLSEVINRADWSKVVSDVTNFLENPSDLNVITKENILMLLKRT